MTAVRSVAALHSSDPLTPHLALWARVPGFRSSDLDAAIEQERSLCRMHAMRRTLWLVPTSDVPDFEAGAARAVAGTERTRLEGWTRDAVGEAAQELLDGAAAAVLDALGDGVLSTPELRERLPILATSIEVGAGKWTTSVPMGSRLMMVLAAEGQVVRTATAGTWRASQYAWARPSAWFGRPVHGGDPADGRAGIVRRYVHAFGPVTTKDLRWWTGFTAKQVQAALADVGAEPVVLESGDGWVAPGWDPPDEVAPTAALLPGLDPSPMGWKERAWFGAELKGPLFDANGNLGPSVWWGGRVVGAWAGRADGVVFELIADVGEEGLRAIRERADALTSWLEGAAPKSRFPSKLERALAARTSGSPMGSVMACAGARRLLDENVGCAGEVVCLWCAGARGSV